MPSLRAGAARALALLGPMPAIPALGHALHDSNPGVSMRAAKALARTGQAALPVSIQSIPVCEVMPDFALRAAIAP